MPASSRRPAAARQGDADKRAPYDLASGVADLLGRPLDEAEPFAVAVSGGVDSLALLLLAQRAFGERVCALTVDHGLRAGSAAEAQRVAEICASLGVAHATLRWEGDKPAANLQAAARTARYRLMADWCTASGVGWLATAHHADDQAETLLLRLARGSGVAGLAGIRRLRLIGRTVTLLRPLLGCRRGELARIVAEAGLVPVDDPSNHDMRFDRTAARALLQAAPWLDSHRIAASAAHLAEAEAALDWMAEQAWAQRAVRSDGALHLDASGLPAELVRRLVRRALVELTPGAAPSGPEIERLIARLSAHRTATLAGVRVVGGGVWRFASAPPRRALQT